MVFFAATVYSNMYVTYYLLPTCIVLNELNTLLEFDNAFGNSFGMTR